MKLLQDFSFPNGGKLDVNAKDFDIKLRQEARENTEEPKTLEEATIPWFGTPYETQLVQKSREVRKILRQIPGKILRDNRQNPLRWVQQQVHFKQLPCPLAACIPSPLLTAYRNKIALSYGRNQTREPCLGFLLGRFADGHVAVENPTNLAFMTPAANSLRNVFQEFLASSELSVYDKSTHLGFWRELTLRTPTTGENGAIVQINSSGLAPEVVQGEKMRLKAFLEERLSGAEHRLVSCLVQDYQGVSNAAPHDIENEVLFGSRHIHEVVLGKRFRISPNAFFQVNTPATELLYDYVKSQCTEATTLLDICCGTGTIGIALADKVSRIIGVDIVPEAIEDARHNAQLNGVQNVTYYADKAETVLGPILSKVDGGSFVAVVDPPRAGLHTDVIRAIRRCAGIKTLIYISCNQNSLVGNATALCRVFADGARPASKTSPGTPFRLLKAQPFDLFPHTPHCELVVVFERLEDPDWDGRFPKAADATGAEANAAAEQAQEEDGEGDAEDATGDEQSQKRVNEDSAPAKRLKTNTEAGTDKA